MARSKAQCYRQLQAVRDEGVWEAWVLYGLKAVEDTCRHTLVLVKPIRTLMEDCKHEMRTKLPRVYSHELLNATYCYPHARIASVQRDLQVSRPTATRYLTLLAQEGLLSKQREGRATHCVNTRLVDLLSDLSVAVAVKRRGGVSGTRPV